MRRAWRRAGASAAGTRHWHLDEAREKKRWLRAKIPEIDNNQDTKRTGPAVVRTAAEPGRWLALL
jgi:hypothetical protein